MCIRDRPSTALRGEGPTGTDCLRQPPPSTPLSSLRFTRPAQRFAASWGAPRTAQMRPPACFIHHPAQPSPL
eukprot:883368-Pyramimonas_sp.AAC.1